jgi:hypothetical protein
VLPTSLKLPSPFEFSSFYPRPLSDEQLHEDYWQDAETGCPRALAAQIDPVPLFSTLCYELNLRMPTCIKCEVFYITLGSPAVDAVDSFQLLIDDACFPYLRTP